MTIEQIKEEMKVLDPAILQELSSFLLKIRRERSPDRKQEIADLIDSSDKKWISLDELDERLKD